MADGDGLTLGSVNMSTQQTHLQRDGAPLIAFSVANLDGDGIIGASTSDGIGVQGTSDSGTGLRGATNTGDGVVGITQGGEESAGVRGTAQIGRAARSSVAFSYRVVAPSADRPARRAIPRTTPAVAAEGRPPDPAKGMGAVLADRLRQRGAGRG